MHSTSMKGQFVYRGGTSLVDADNPDDNVIEAANDSVVIDTEDLSFACVYLNQITDAGTVVLKVEGTVDGTNWMVIDASTAETDFPAGANTAVELPLEATGGMSKHYKKVKVTCTALAGGGVYTAGVAGLQRTGYAG